MVLKVSSTLRTTSDEAELMVVGMIPVEIPAKEMGVVYCAKRLEEHIECKNAVRSESHGV